MKTCKLLSLLFFVLLAFNCSSDDDGSNDGDSLSVIQLLTSGRWYQESRIPGSYTECEKLSYLEFYNDGDFNLESFEDDGGDCMSLGLMTATFTLTSDTMIIISFEGDNLPVEIVSISENLLTITTAENETLIFDKIEG